MSVVLKRTVEDLSARQNSSQNSFVTAKCDFSALCLRFRLCVCASALTLFFGVPRRHAVGDAASRGLRRVGGGTRAQRLCKESRAHCQGRVHTTRLCYAAI